MNRSVMVSLLFFTFSVLADKEPNITYITPQQERYVGGQVQLSCTTEEAFDYPVMWIKFNQRGGESFPISTNGLLITADPRYSLKHDNAKQTFTLSIKDLKASDAGYYECEILVSVTKKVRAGVELTVLASET